jgi:hypothetical protein
MEALCHKAKQKLIELIELLNNLSYDDYVKHIYLLNKASIAIYTNAIIFKYSELQLGYVNNIVVLDNNKDFKPVYNIDCATELLANIIKNLLKPNKVLLVQASKNFSYQSSYYKELEQVIQYTTYNISCIKVAINYLASEEHEQLLY